MAASLPLMEVSLKERYVVKTGILLPTLRNLTKSSHCVPIGEKFLFAGIS